jgi:type I restriction enzyme, S subunit
MAKRARLSAPHSILPEASPYHEVKWTAVPARLLMQADRRMEAEGYLSGGHAIRHAIEAQPKGWNKFGALARVWQPSRLKGIQVSREHGTPFLSATQVFDLRPTPRKWLAIARTHNAQGRFVERGTILVTCSGTVGRATLAYSPHLDTLITHDLLRVEVYDDALSGWLYAYLRSEHAGAMMTGAQYGHMIKHLECAHLNSLPVPVPPQASLERFKGAVQTILRKRDEAHALTAEAEDRFAAAVGKIIIPANPEVGFEASASALFGGRRRLEAAHHTPEATAILKHFRLQKLRVEPLSDVTERVWWMTRFSRVFGDTGVPYLSADELFSLNPRINKRVLIEQVKAPKRFFVKEGWIIVACSGQTYGLLGSVSLMTNYHERSFFSHDLVRVRPKRDKIHPGYLVTAMGHPKLGRPLLLRYAYGTSIPHLDPADVRSFPVVRLGDETEREIGELMWRAAELRVEADDLENTIAAEADAFINKFISSGSTPRLIIPTEGG